MKLTLTSLQHDADDYIDALYYIVENWESCIYKIGIEFTTLPSKKKVIEVSGSFLITENGETTVEPRFYISQSDLRNTTSYYRGLTFRRELRDIILATNKEYQDLLERQKMFDNLMRDVFAKKVAYISDNTPLKESVLDFAVWSASKEVDTKVRQFEKSVSQFVGLKG